MQPASLRVPGSVRTDRAGRGEAGEEEDSRAAPGRVFPGIQNTREPGRDGAASGEGSVLCSEARSVGRPVEGPPRTTAHSEKFHPLTQP